MPGKPHPSLAHLIGMEIDLPGAPISNPVVCSVPIGAPCRSCLN